ncbi:MAG: DegV family protein [Candidatus Nomurabacteria bacterium]|nr:DegV family protein [Candidatus Nomurabacteria bacterium]
MKKEKRSYCIVTDATADLTPEEVKKHNIRVIPMIFTIAEKEYEHNPDWSNMPYEKFYWLAKTEKIFTSQIPPAQFENVFRECLETHDDILFLCFSSGISGTFHSSQLARDAVQTQFPDRKIYVVDTKTTSVGLGSLTIQAAELRAAGHSIDAVHAKILETVPRLALWFTVRDISGLQRSGRCTSLEASVGNALNRKPVLYVNENGKLKKAKTVRGQERAFDEIVEKIARLATTSPNEQTIQIANGDFQEAVNYLARHIKGRWPSCRIKIVKVSPIVGSHTGAGVVGVLFEGTKTVDAPIDFMNC